MNVARNLTVKFGHTIDREKYKLMDKKDGINRTLKILKGKERKDARVILIREVETIQWEIDCLEELKQKINRSDWYSEWYSIIEYKEKIRNGN